MKFTKEIFSTAMFDLVPMASFWAKAKSGLGLFDFHKAPGIGAGTISQTGVINTESFYQKMYNDQKHMGWLEKYGYGTAEFSLVAASAISLLRGDGGLPAALLMGVYFIHKLVAYGFMARHIVHQEI